MASQLRIALIAPLAESVPPRGYGGTERVVSYLCEELVAQQHQVTLFASADSHTQAELVVGAPQALRGEAGSAGVPMGWYMLMLEKLYQRVDDFDIIHSHVDYLPYSMMRRLGKPMLSTMHGRMDLPEYRPLYDEFRDMALVSISYAQRRPLPAAPWVDTIYHGLPRGLYSAGEGGDYLAFVGRMSPEKRVDDAIEVAVRAGVPIKIAAKVDPSERAYFEAVIEPLLGHELVDFIGEVGEAEKTALLKGARAFLFMVDWPEPFGLAMIEAMACGTPVIARRCGSIPEVVDHGVTGFVCDNLTQAVEAVGALDNLDRGIVRQTFERRFSAARMARDYVLAYRDQMLNHYRAGLSDIWDMGIAGDDTVRRRPT